MEVQISMFQFMALATVVYYLGTFIVSHVGFLKKYSIPAPVVGGLVMAIVKLFFYLGGITFTMDTTVQSIFQFIFFASIGYNCRFNMLKKGGVMLILVSLATALLILTQNGVGVAFAKLFGLDPNLGYVMGSIPLVGGHGTVGNWGMVLDDLGVENAFMVGIACASYGLIAGGLMGNPIAKLLITRKKLQVPGAESNIEMDEVHHTAVPLNKKKLFLAGFLLMLTVGLGDVLLKIIAALNIPFKAMSIGTLFVGMIIRNVCDAKKVELPDAELSVVSSFALNAYLGLAMLTVNLWQLADLALPMLVVMIIQTIIMALFAYFVVFNVCGRDYEAAVIASGVCGFGMGAAFTGMANMEGLRKDYGDAPKAFVVVPILGAFIVDLMNTTFFTIVTTMLAAAG